MHGRRALRVSFAALLVLACCKGGCGAPAAVSLGPPEQPPPLEATAAAPAPDLDPAPAPERLAIAGSECPRAACELTITFGVPMVAPGELSSGPKLAQIEPPQDGTWAWRSPTELVFTPAPGALNWGNSFSVTVPAATPPGRPELALGRPWEWSFTVGHFSAGGKVAYWPVVAGDPRFVGILNRFSGQIGAGPLFLLYDQPVDAAKVKARLRATDASGRPLRTNVARPTETDQVLSEPLDPSHLVAVRLVDLPGNGSTVALDVPDRPDAPDGGTSRQPLVVTTRLALESARLVAADEGEVPAGRPVPLEVTLVLELTNPFEPGLLAKSLVVQPAPRAVSTTGGGTTASVQLSLSPGTRYTAKLRPGFTDVLGNRPASEVKVSFASRDLPPLLAAPALPATVEEDRARLPVKLRNVERVTAEAVRLESPGAFALATARGAQPSCEAYGATGEPERLELPRAAAALNADATIEVPLPARPGLLCVQLAATGRGSEARGPLQQAALVQSSALGITAKVFPGGVLAWVTGLADASPVAGASVTLLDAQGGRLAQATADASGTALLPARNLATAVGVEKPLFLVAEKDGRVAVSQVRNELLSKPWQFGLKGAVAEATPLDAAVFTDRGAYRPGETVHLKLVAAGRPAGATAVVAVADARGQQVARTELRLDAFSAAATDVVLKEAAPVGVYAVDVAVGGQHAARTFRVEEYRVPTFRVAVEGGDWRRGAEAAATISAAYLHGGSLDGRAVRWEVTRTPEPFAPAGLPGFVFGLAETLASPATVVGREERLDGRGRLTVRFRPEHPSGAGPMRYTVEAAVTDVDRQAYAGRFSRVVHPAAFYVGLRPPSRAILSAGETLEVPVVAVTPGGETLAGAEVRARLERVDWHTTARLGGGGAEGPPPQVQVLSRPVPVEKAECLVTTQATPVPCRLALPEAGQYRVRVWAQDVEHQVVQAGFGVTVSGGNPIAWPRFDQDRIELVADRPSYAPGDVARLVVQTPFDSAHGLLTIERDGVLSSRAFRIRRDTPAIEVRVEPEWAPNVFASVVLVRGRVHDQKDATGFETGAPAFKMGYAKLTVEPRAQRLAVGVAPSRDVANPGQKVALAVTVRDDRGRPAAAQATVWVVDEAVLGLTGYRTPDPVAQLHAEKPLSVRTGESRLELPHAKRSRLEQLFPAGDGGEADGPRAPPPDLLRALFQSTAYWNPDVAVGADGTATVELTLPDNTTTYRVMAVAVDPRGRAGAAERRLVAKLPLMVQAVTPRFVHPGDELAVEALVFNGSGAAGEAEVTAELAGLAPQRVLAPQRLAVADGRTASARFPVKVTGKGAASVRFAVRLGAHRDRVEVKVPILEPGARRVLVASRTVSGNEPVSLALPADRVPGTVKAEVVASTTALTELKDAVQYLMDYPNGCIEQTTSTAYPLVMLKDLLPEIGVEVDPAELRKFTEAGIRRILSFQTTAGGLAYWPGSDEPHAFATAFGLTALVEGKKRGFDVPDQALSRMADYLEAALRKGDVTESIPHGGIADGDTRAFFVMTLGRLGRPQPAYLGLLWEKRDGLTAFGLSFLGIAAAELPGASPLTGPILAAVRRKATEEIEEAWYSDGPKGGYSFDSPLRTHASALLAYAEGAPTSDLTGKLLTGLLKRRRGGLWGNTQENVFGIMGVHALLGGRQGGGQGGASAELALEVNGRRYDGEALQKPSRRVRRLALAEDALGLAAGKEGAATARLAGGGGKPVILTVRAELDLELNDRNRAPTRNGFTIARSYETLDGATLDGAPVPLGALVRVRLKVRSREAQNYVAIDDRLPAGLEPLNAALATTEKVAQGALSEAARRGLALLSYGELRDHRVAFYVDAMPAGDYEFAYVARAATAGRFLRPAARAEAMYRPDVSGTTAIDEVVVR
ncbi:MAG TPA: MG2 domain-containing protein [Anaeromyxobacter sp.]|nr:MG2 domain-containing protein [Anaeromyxobacter sp.]